MREPLKLLAAMLLASAAISMLASNGHAGIFPPEMKCPANMSCIVVAGKLSPIPAPMSPIPIEFKAATTAPENCIGNIMGNLTRDELTVCERFVAENGGTRREIATALANLGYAYMYWSPMSQDRSAGAYSQARKTWDRAIAVDNTFIEPYLAKGNVVAVGATPYDALAIFDKALAIDPKDWRVHAGMANAYINSEMPVEALAAAARAAELAPGNPNTRYVKGYMLERNRRFKEAISEYHEAVKNYKPGQRRRPGMLQDENPWDALARTYHRNGDHNLAAATVGKYLDAQQYDPMAPLSIGDRLMYGDRATYLEAAGRFAEAADDLLKAALIDVPEIAKEFTARRAILLVRAGRQNEARDEFDALLRRGDLHTILRTQVFLRNSGYEDVEIDGKYNDSMKTALSQCLADEKCAAGLGQPI